MSLKKEELQARIDAFTSFAQQQDWNIKIEEKAQGNKIPLLVDDGKTVISLTFSPQGGIYIRGIKRELRSAIKMWCENQGFSYRDSGEELLTRSPYGNIPGAWKFHRGNWEQTFDYMHGPYKDVDEKKEIFYAAGYNPIAQLTVGNPESNFYVTVYPRYDERLHNGKEVHPGLYSYYVEVVLFNREGIFVTDFPSLIQLLGQLSTIIGKQAAERRVS